MEIHNFGKIIWTRDKETSSYSSITGRWVIKKDKSKWFLGDTKTGEIYENKSLKACQKTAEGIFEDEEKERIQSKSEIPDNLGNFVPVQAKVLK